MTSSLTRPLLAAVLAVTLAACAPGTASPPSPLPSPADLPASVPPASGPAGYPGWPPLAEGGELLPIPVTSELVVGQNRFLLNLVDASNEPLASPDRPVSLRFYDLAADATAPATTVEGTYLPTLPQLPGLYRATVDFGRAGNWGIEAVATEPDGSTRSGRMVFSVRPSGSTPAIGADAPVSATPTAETPAEIALISSDRDPRPDFYRSSVADALAAGQPFLLVFATPAFCRTATCGPALDIVKEVAPQFEGRVEVIHVEPYQLEQVEGHLQPVLRDGQLVPVPSVLEWGLLTEPMLFAVDARGKVTAKLEGVASADEIRAALEAIAE